VDRSQDRLALYDMSALDDSVCEATEDLLQRAVGDVEADCRKVEAEEAAVVAARAAATLEAALHVVGAREQDRQAAAVAEAERAVSAEDALRRFILLGCKAGLEVARGWGHSTAQIGQRWSLCGRGGVLSVVLARTEGGGVMPAGCSSGLNEQLLELGGTAVVQKDSQWRGLVPPSVIKVLDCVALHALHFRHQGSGTTALLEFCVTYYLPARPSARPPACRPSLRACPPS
jgi:hypothetical protein